MNLRRVTALLIASAVALAGPLAAAPAEAAAARTGVVVRYDKRTVTVQPKVFQPVKLRFSTVLPFYGRPVFTSFTATEITSNRSVTRRLPGAVDWSNMTVVMPTNAGRSGCPTGRVTVRNGTGVAGRKKVSLSRAKAYGDLTRDRVTDTVLYVHCESTGGVGSGDGAGNLLVATQRDGMLVGVGHAGPVGENYGAARVRNGRLVATVQQRYGTGVQQRSYRWNGGRFMQVAGPTTFPAAR
jgi:hypothetical protein